VELAAVTGQDDVAPAICEALGVVRQPGRQALDTLLDALATQDVLIVIDNCEHLIGACAKTADAILRHCPNAQLVATSREPLSISGEAIYRVPPLSLPRPGDRDAAALEPSDAVALFVARAKEQGAGLSADDQTSLLIAATLAVAQRPQRPHRPAIPAAHRGKPHRAGAAADPAGDRRLVLFTAPWGRAVAAAAPVGVHRQFRSGRR